MYNKKKIEAMLKEQNLTEAQQSEMIKSTAIYAIGQITGIDAEKRPYSAFLKWICDPTITEDYQVKCLTGLSDEEYDEVFQENDEQGVREIILTKESGSVLGNNMRREDILPHQYLVTRLLMMAVKDYTMKQIITGNLDIVGSTLSKDKWQEQNFAKVGRDEFVDELGWAYFEAWMFYDRMSNIKEVEL